VDPSPCRLVSRSPLVVEVSEELVAADHVFNLPQRPRIVAQAYHAASSAYGKDAP
jgi:hypothetical protein